MAKNALTHPTCSFDRFALPNYSLFSFKNAKYKYWRGSSWP